VNKVLLKSKNPRQFSEKTSLGFWQYAYCVLIKQALDSAVTQAVF
jgi:hypothetical protein